MAEPGVCWKMRLCADYRRQAVTLRALGKHRGSGFLRTGVSQSAFADVSKNRNKLQTCPADPMGRTRLPRVPALRARRLRRPVNPETNPRRADGMGTGFQSAGKTLDFISLRWFLSVERK